MPPKRKSDALNDIVVGDVAGKDGLDGKIAEDSIPTLDAKKARVDGPSEASGSKGKKQVIMSWKDVVLEGEEEGEVPIYDDCNEIRRKIRALQKQPGFKITHWLRDIGGINSNSYGRFMKLSGANSGASNGLYYAAYVYFEKVRIAEGKKKTAKRERNEAEHPNGFPLVDGSKIWVFMPR